jgi:hypothetical protein
MRLIPSSLLVLTAAATLNLAHGATVIDNANGYTLDSKNQLLRFTSMAFDDKGRIIAVGSAEHTAARAKKARHVDMGGKTVLPGLIDAHGHVFGLGQTADPARPGRQRLAARRPEGDRPTPAPIRTRPGCADAAGTRKSGSWAASRPRRTRRRSSRPPGAGSSASTATPAGPTAARWHWPASRTARPDPAGGKIVRDANGKADRRAGRRGPGAGGKGPAAQTEAEGRAMLDRALARSRAVGLTSVHDAGIGVAGPRCTATTRTRAS